jgi:hypothetical protein
MLIEFGGVHSKTPPWSCERGEEKTRDMPAADDMLKKHVPCQALAGSGSRFGIRVDPIMRLFIPQHQARFQQGGQITLLWGKDSC